ncbi:MAG: signal recognition particle-docking protein FtsY [Nitrososphaeria archaeon]|nr:signal recognition particle-docking protein FtsY [Nitrososphaeria archaeon]
MFERFRGQLISLIRSVSDKELTEEQIEKEIHELGFILVQNDVALETAEHISERVKDEVIGTSVRRLGKAGPLLKETLKRVVYGIFEDTSRVDLIQSLDKAKDREEPFKILFIGNNGTGKTTTIAKMSKLVREKGHSIVLACSDTYRAGAIEQLEIHAERLGIRIIKHRYGADPAAVAYDAVEHARARGIDVVMIDTAGRQHTDYNLMKELNKIKRIIEPNLVILIVDSLTGNDALAQARDYLRFTDFQGVVLTKMDADAKGGAAISIVHQTKRPILFIGTGQGYDDLQAFDRAEFIETLIGS